MVDKLIEECNETIEEVKLTNITIFKNENNYKYNSCIVYIVLMVVFFTIFTGITVYLVYYKWSLVQIMFLTLNLILIKKQKFSECNSIE